MTSSQGPVAIGSARANRWRVTDDVVDTTRPPIEPRPLSVAARPKRVIIDLARGDGLQYRDRRLYHRFDGHHGRAEHQRGA